MLLLALCMWGHVSEVFDHWDNTFQTGNDVEYSTVILALVTGAVICFAQVAAILVGRVSVISYLLPFVAACGVGKPRTGDLIGHSPPLSLRI